MGHIAHLRKQLNSINTYDYHNVNWEKKNPIIYENWMVLQLNTLESPLQKDALCQIWLKLALWFWRKRFLISSMYFCYLIIISPWKRVGPTIWTNLNPLYPRMLCAKFGWNWLSGSGEEDFLISSMYFHYFVIISPWKRVGPFIWTNLNPLHPRMLCAKFGWNWLSGSEEEDFLISSMYFHYFVIISPWKRAGPFNWTNMTSLHLRMFCAKCGWNWPSDSGEEEL